MLAVCGQIRLYSRTSAKERNSIPKALISLGLLSYILCTFARCRVATQLNIFARAPVFLCALPSGTVALTRQYLHACKHVQEDIPQGSKVRQAWSGGYLHNDHNVLTSDDNGHGPLHTTIKCEAKTDDQVRTIVQRLALYSHAL